MLTAAEIAALSAEIDGRLRHATVQKIAEPAHWTLVLGTPRDWLLLCVAPQLARLHLAERKPAGSGESPSAFCMLLRKHLEGARLISCAAVPGERAVLLDFQRGPFAAADSTEPVHIEPRWQLRLFLFGRASQLQLVDESGHVVSGYGPARALHPLPTPRPLDENAPATTSAVVAERFAAVADSVETGDGSNDIRRALKSERSKLIRLVRGLTEDLARADAAASKRQWADLLLAHLAEIPRGAASVTLPDDFSDGSPVEITLLPDRSARANAERFYAEHKRLHRARARIEARLAETRATLERVQHDEAALAAGEPLSGPVLPASKPSARAKTADVPALPYREYRSASGQAILVGKGADKNDALTFGVAAGRDLWLHARDVAGAHVVVSAAGRPVDEQTLLDAATLAAHFSQARGEAQVDITYTLKKNVRKAKGRGRVHIADAKTLRIRLEPARLDRLIK